MILTPSGEVVDAKMGVCPKCGSANLDYNYSDLEWCGSCTAFKTIQCKDCFTCFDEVYKLQFVSQDNVEVPTFSD